MNNQSFSTFYPYLLRIAAGILFVLAAIAPAGADTALIPAGANWKYLDAFTAFNGAQHVDAWLMLGDNAYDSGTDPEYQAAVFDKYPALLRKTLLWTTIGNHETNQSQSQSLVFPYLDIFSLPTSGEGGGLPSGTEKYYSFDLGQIHFICLDAMTSNRTTTGPMAQWLRADLESTMQKWIIAFWHHPPYTKGSHNSDAESQLIQMRERFLPILEAGGVDLVLCGHSTSMSARNSSMGTTAFPPRSRAAWCSMPAAAGKPTPAPMKSRCFPARQTKARSMWSRAAAVRSARGRAAALRTSIRRRIRSCSRRCAGWARSCSM